MVDYRKFDKIDDEIDLDDDNNNNERKEISSPSLPPSSLAPPPPPQQQTKKGKENRLQFEYQGQLIYEWEQSLEEVMLELFLFSLFFHLFSLSFTFFLSFFLQTNIFITPPPGVTKKDFDIKITPHHLRIGLKNLPPFIDV